MCIYVYMYKKDFFKPNMCVIDVLIWELLCIDLDNKFVWFNKISSFFSLTVISINANFINQSQWHPKKSPCGARKPPH